MGAIEVILSTSHVAARYSSRSSLHRSLKRIPLIMQDFAWRSSMGNAAIALMANGLPDFRPKTHRARPEDRRAKCRCARICVPVSRQTPVWCQSVSQCVPDTLGHTTTRATDSACVFNAGHIVGHTVGHGKPGVSRACPRVPTVSRPASESVLPESPGLVLCGICAAL